MKVLRARSIQHMPNRMTFKQFNQQQKTFRHLPQFGDAKARFLNQEAAPQTKRTYKQIVARFMAFLEVQTYDELIFKNPPSREKYTVEELHNRIDAFIFVLKQSGLKRQTVLTALWALSFFYLANDVSGVNWDSLTKKAPRDDRVKENGATKMMMYTAEQIQEMLALANDSRDRALTLFLASKGVRAGAFSPEYNGKGKLVAPGLCVSHLFKVSEIMPENHRLASIPEYAEQYRRLREYDGYLMVIYAGTRHEYFTFTTEEAARAIDRYLEDRHIKRENVGENSPLFREIFSERNKNKEPCSITAAGAATVFRNLQRRMKMRPIDDEHCNLERGPSVRRDVKVTHGLHKFVDTMMSNSQPKVDSEFREMMLGHDCGLQENYYDYTQPESVYRALSEYIKAASLLTITGGERLKVELASRGLLLKEAENLS